MLADGDNVAIVALAGLEAQAATIDKGTAGRARILNRSDYAIGVFHLTDNDFGVFLRYGSLCEVNRVGSRTTDGVQTQIQRPILATTCARNAIQEAHDGFVVLGLYRSGVSSGVSHVAHAGELSSFVNLGLRGDGLSFEVSGCGFTNTWDNGFVVAHSCKC